MPDSTYIYDGNQGSIEVTKGACGYNIIITRNFCGGGSEVACVGDFSKERLREIATKLQQFVDSI